MRTNDLTKGSPAKVLLLFALPMILSVTLQQIYNIADSAIAGNFISNNALSSVSASYPVTMIYLAIASGFGIGVGVVTSKFFGAKSYSDVKEAITTGLLSIIAIGIVMTIIATSLNSIIINLIDTPKNIFDDASTYLMFYSCGLLFCYLYNTTTFIFQALGNSKTPLLFLVFSTVLNIILDLIFVLCCNMGVAGLGLGTLIAQAASAILSFTVLIFSLKKLGLHGKKLFNTQIFKQILGIAIPSIIQGSTIAIGQFLIQKQINSYGEELIAGYGASYKLCYVVVNIFTSMSNAISTFTSQNIGASKHKRIISCLKSSLVLCLTFALLMFALLALLPKQLLSIFLNEDASTTTVEYGCSFIYIVAPFFLLMGIKIPCDGVLKGSRDMLGFMIGTLADLVLRVVLSFILNNLMGYKGIFIAWPISWAVGTLISVFFIFYGRWKRLASWPSIKEYQAEEI